MSSWFHTVLGRYNISDRWIGLDYGKLFLDPVLANLTMAHEVTHSVLAMTTDFGQTANVVVKLIDDFINLNDGQRNEIGTTLLEAQTLVQEGFATFMEVSQLRKLTNRNHALNWARQNLPQDYLERFNELSFAFDLSQGYRDFFTAKITHLAMETGIRKFMPKLNLLENPELLKNYLNDVNNNPDARLKKIIKTLMYKTWLVTKPIPEIANACDVVYFEPATKEEVANFLTYVASFTSNPRTFRQSEIGDTPQGSDAFKQAGQNMIVANMNLNLAETATPLFNLNDFLFHSDKMEIMFVNLHDENWKHKDLVKLVSGTDPEISIGGFLRTGEKFLTVTSKEKAAELLNNQLQQVTMMVKWGGFDLIKGKLIWSNNVRTPDIVVYNTTQEMTQRFRELLKAKPESKFIHLHAGASENHPLQTLIVRAEGTVPIHIVNAYGNKGITEVIKTINHRSRVMSDDELLACKRHINNIMSLWMGLHWDVDWVESMLDKKTLIFRK